MDTLSSCRQNRRDPVLSRRYADGRRERRIGRSVNVARQRLGQDDWGDLGTQVTRSFEEFR